METLIKDNSFISSLDWRKKGSLVPVYNKNVFTIDTGGNHENCIVILHGYLSSSYDYYKVLTELSKNHRVIVQDLIGFGFSDKPEKKYFTIIDQTDYVLELWNLLGLNNVTLISNGFGNLLTTEILARQNHTATNVQIKKIFFCNGDIPINHYNYLDIHNTFKDVDSEKMISMLTSFGIYKKIIKDYFYDETKITDEELKEKWIQLENNNGRDIINFIYHCVRERKIFWNRWATALKETENSIEFIWGKEDKITRDWLGISKEDEITIYKVSLIEKSGHLPMLETPQEWLQCVLKK
jgi:pimeloyl-ACP methyl ester carboxylesterase